MISSPDAGLDPCICLLGHLAFLLGFALVFWRLAIRYMERKLIL
jgi:hypothetical protein